MRNTRTAASAPEFAMPLQLLDEEFDTFDLSSPGVNEDGLVPHAPVATGTEWDDDSGVSEGELI